MTICFTSNTEITPWKITEIKWSIGPSNQTIKYAGQFELGP